MSHRRKRRDSFKIKMPMICLANVLLASLTIFYSLHDKTYIIKVYKSTMTPSCI